MKNSISEILQKISELPGRNLKVEALQKEETNTTLLRILSLCFDPKVIWDLPEGKPPYKQLGKAHDAQSVLYAESRRLRIFIKGMGYDNLHPRKKETLFIQLLESLDKDDAELLLSIKDKVMPYKGVTLNVVKKAFPELAETW